MKTNYINYKNHPLQDELDENIKDFYFNIESSMTEKERVSAWDTILNHGQTRGNRLEAVIANHYGFIHSKSLVGYDAKTKCGRPVEIKTEKFGANTKTKKGLNAVGKFENKKSRKGDAYKKDRPIIITSGTCDETALCMYVLWVDTKKLPENASIFKELNKKTVSLGMQHYLEYPEAFEFVFSDMILVEDAFKKGKLSRNLHAEIMKQYRPTTYDILGTATDVNRSYNINLTDEVSRIIYKRITNDNHSDSTKEFVAYLNDKGFKTKTGLEWTEKRYYAKTKAIRALIAIRESCNI
jgi:hypothetical protein